MKRIYISHPFANDIEGNRKKVTEICRELEAQGYLPISPIHLFGWKVDDSNREEVLKADLELMWLCEELWKYGESEGCNLEEEYATTCDIPVRRMY